MLGKTHDGKPIPNWDDLGDQVRAGWDAAGAAAADTVSFAHGAASSLGEIIADRERGS